MIDRACPGKSVPTGRARQGRATPARPRASGRQQV